MKNGRTWLGSNSNIGGPLIATLIALASLCVSGTPAMALNPTLPQICIDRPDMLSRMACDAAPLQCMADTSQSLEFQQGSEDVKNRIYSECIAKYIQAFEANLKQQKRQLKSETDARCSANAPGSALITACTELIQSGDETPVKLARDYFWRGGAYCVEGKTDLAIPDFIESIRLDPTQRDSYNYLDKIYIDRDQYDDVIKNANVAILNDPKNAIAYRQRGLAYVVGLHDLGRGYADLDIAVKLDPNDRDALEMRGLVEKKLGRVADGERDIAKAHTMKPVHTVFR